MLISAFPTALFTIVAVFTAYFYESCCLYSLVCARVTGINYPGPSCRRVNECIVLYTQFSSEVRLVLHSLVYSYVPYSTTVLFSITTSHDLLHSRYQVTITRHRLFFKKSKLWFDLADRTSIYLIPLFTSDHVPRSVTCS